MKTDNTNALYIIIYFIVTLLVAWVAFSLIITWFNPQLTENGNVNWWTTLWVSALIIIFSWLFMLILYFIINLFTKKSPKVECDPCAVPKQNWAAQCPQPCPPPCPPPQQPCPPPCPPPPCPPPPCPRPQPCPPPPCPPRQPCPPPPCPRPQYVPPSPCPQQCAYPCTKPYLHQCSMRQSNMGHSNMGHSNMGGY